MGTCLHISYPSFIVVVPVFKMMMFHCYVSLPEGSDVQCHFSMSPTSKSTTQRLFPGNCAHPIARFHSAVTAVTGSPRDLISGHRPSI